MDSHAAADPPPATAEGADSASRTPEADVVAVVAADLDAEDVSDLHDCFGLMYAGSEWASDDEDAQLKRQTDLFDLPRLLSELAALVAPTTSVPSKRRLFPPRAHDPSIFPSTTPLPTLPAFDTYAPFSPLPFLARLRTFGAAGLSPSVPPAVGAEACALHGWVSAGRDALVCARKCGAQWGVAGLGELSANVRRGVVSKLAATLSSRHTAGCAWRTTVSPPELVAQLRRTLHPLTAASLAPLARAVAQQSLAGPVAPVWTSPASESEIRTLAIALRRHQPSPGHSHPTDSPAENDAEPTPSESLAAALALFGWYPYDPSFPADHVVAHGTPTDIVACRLCRRRVGLWTFAPEHGREFDLAGSHVSWCPLRAGDGWWRECALVHPQERVSDPAALSAMLVVSEGDRPAKRWRRGGAARMKTAAAAGAGQ